MTQDQMLAIFTLAKISVDKFWKLDNGYWPEHPNYYEVRAASPWWLARTPLGLIQIGWRKRVINIDWSATSLQVIVTTDDVTKSKTNVHAWDETKAVEYLKALLAFHQAEQAVEVRHGVNCPKAAHDGTGHLHSELDDGPYDVDGVTYCGRCHTSI